MYCMYLYMCVFHKSVKELWIFCEIYYIPFSTDKPLEGVIFNFLLWPSPLKEMINNIQMFYKTSNFIKMILKFFNSNNGEMKILRLFKYKITVFNIYALNFSRCYLLTWYYFALLYMLLLRDYHTYK